MNVTKWCSSRTVSYCCLYDVWLILDQVFGPPRRVFAHKIWLAPKKAARLSTSEKMIPKIWLNDTTWKYSLKLSLLKLVTLDPRGENYPI